MTYRPSHALKSFAVSTIATLAICLLTSLLAQADSQLDPLLTDPNMPAKSDGSALPSDLAKDFKALAPEATSKQRTPANDATHRLDPLLTQPGVKLKVNSTAWPTDIAKDFSDANVAPERLPASSKSAMGRPSNRRSRLPAHVTDGFEMRVRYGNLVSTFWVVKRSDRYDLLFSNNEGSQATLGLAPENFRALQGAALAIPSGDVNIATCKNAIMQMYIVQSKGRERTITACVAGKTKPAEGLRNMGNLLSSMVR